MKGSAPDTVINAVNKDFEASHAGTKVKVELQEWANIGTKTTTALASNNPPDVLEIGNSLTAGFADAGGLQDLTDKKSDLGGDDWNKGLEASSTVGNKLYAVPYYAGTRVVLYRKDLYTAAGITAPPATLDELIATGPKLAAKNKTPGFSPFYVPGKYWYMGLGFVHGFGGQIAKQEGDKWSGALSSPESVKGLEAFKDFSDKMSKAPKEATEADPPQINALAEGKAAAIFDAGWQLGVIEKDHPELVGKIGTYALPGPEAGKAMPTFLGGSNLAISENAKSPNNAYDWLKLLSGSKYQTQLFTEAKVIPNTNTLLAEAAKDPAIKPSADAAANGWFVPSDPNWTEVEAGSTLPDLFVNVVTAKKSPADAAKAADETLASTLSKK